MGDAHFEKLRDLFGQALDLSEGERAELLKAVQRDSTALAGELQDMLRAHDREDEFLDPDNGPVASIQSSTPASARLEGTTVGGYRVIRLIAIGGMGAVYEAVQERPRRQVALKVLHPHLASDEFARRFEREAEFLGALTHPGIAQIHEAGTHEYESGVVMPYISMELVHGEALMEYVQTAGIDRRALLRLMVDICEAVEYAHQAGIIHRDLKPSNILVDERGNPRILDFGVARATDADIKATTFHTHTGSLVGTLAYMSPEQATGDPKAIGTQADVHALGVLLFESLTGRLPYDLHNRPLHEAVRILRDEEPSGLRALMAACPSDLDTIVGKALEKEPGRRYTSAGQLAADLGRYLDGVPIHARPASQLYQLSKFARRNRLIVGAVSMVILAMAIGLVVANQARGRAEQEAAAANLLSNYLLAAIAAEDPIGRAPVGQDPLNWVEQRDATDFLSWVSGGLGVFEEAPGIELRLQQAISRAYWGREMYAECLEASRRALELGSQLSPSDRVMLLSNYGVSLERMGQPGGRDSVLKAKELAVRELPPHDIGRLVAENSWLNWTKKNSQPEEYLLEMESLIERATKAFTKFHGFTCSLYEQKWRVMAASGQKAEAVRQCAEYMAEMDPPNDFVPTAAALSYQAAWSGHLGEWQACADYWRESASRGLRENRDNERYPTIAMASEGYAYYKLGNHERADELIRRAALRADINLDATCMSAFRVFRICALHVERQGDQREEEVWFRKCIPYLTRPVPPTQEDDVWHNRLIKTWNGLRRAGRFDEALVLLQEAPWKAQFEDRDQDECADIAKDLAWAMRDGDPQELAQAEAFARWAVGIQVEDAAEYPLLDLHSRRALAYVLWSRGEHDEAALLFRDLVSRATDRLGPGDVNTAGYRLLLGQVLLDQKDLDGALQQYEAVLQASADYGDGGEMERRAKSAIDTAIETEEY